ncbi:zinc ribbon domain-containing protein [Variovorax sp. 160MFSha2.1]|uniref:zinc ribbon domain-containing protein n=1 Tax=Variovorax sp. 160MFSha2.1 TaxID=3158367 RepID=UPI003AB0D363
MASICPVCSTENRDGANFCRNCGIKLSAAGDRIPPPPTPEREWATTAPAQLRAPTIPAPLEELPPAPSPARQSFFSRSPASAPRHDDDEQTVFMLHDDGSPRVPAPPATPQGLESSWAPSPERVKTPRVRIRKPAPVDRPPRKRAILLWVGLLAVAVAMIVAGWSGYGTRKTAPAVEETAPPAVAPAPAAAAPAVEPPPSPPSPPPAEPPATDAQPAEQAAPSPAAEAAPAVSPPPKPAKQARKQPAAAAAPQPAAETAAPVAAPALPPAPAAAAEPAAMCGDRNFIARAQCMAAQCLKPEYKAHAQCEAVRRQQRIEEEKRNPTLIN